MVTGAKGLGPEKDYSGEGQQHIEDRPILSSERAPDKNKIVTTKE
jgi:hypothetical protein